MLLCYSVFLYLSILFLCFLSSFSVCCLFVIFFFFNDTATTEIYTLSLHDALPIWLCPLHDHPVVRRPRPAAVRPQDRKSTRLNSSHSQISYAVFCLKKKKKYNTNIDSQQQQIQSMQR